MRALIILIVATVSSVALAGDSVLPSVDLRDRRAVAAYDLFQKQSQQARDIYVKAMTKAREQAIAQLEKIRAELAETTDRQETAAVQAAIDKLKAGLTDPEKEESAEQKQLAKGKFTKLLINSLWQVVPGGSTVTFREDGTIDISHIDERRPWTVTEELKVKFAPFHDEKTYTFTLNPAGDKLIDDNGLKTIVFEFRKKK